MSEWFRIKSVEEFTEKTRAIVFNNFGLWENKSNEDLLMSDSIDVDDINELNEILPHAESLVIVKEALKKERHKTTKKIRYLINEKIFSKIIEKLNSRMVSNILSGLVQKGLVESAFDSEANDFIFWVKDEYKEKPETD